MKIRHKVMAFLTSVCMLTAMWGMSVFAASGNVSVSSASGNVGDVVTINASVSSSSGAIGSASVYLSYDPSALQFVGGSGDTNGGGGSVSYASVGNGSSSSLRFSMTFKILKSGTHGISGSADGYTWGDEEQMSMSVGGGSVTGNAPAPKPVPKPEPTPKPEAEPNKTEDKDKDKDKEDEKDKDKDKKSENAKLSSLSVKPGGLEPAFSADQKSYKVNVPKDTKEVTITAKAQDAKAKVSITGGKNLKPGSNAAKVVVTAENGDTQTYQIIIQCGEEKEAEIKIDDKVYHIYNEFKEEDIPIGFIRTKMVIRNEESVVMQREKGKITLVCLSSDQDKKEFYIYNEKKDEFYPFLHIKMSEGKYIIPLAMDQKAKMPKGYKNVILKLQDKELQAWQGNDKDFYIIRAVNDDGVVGLYRYDSKDNTYQRYIMEESFEGNKEKAQNDDKVNIVGKLGMNKEYCGPTILGLTLLSIVLLIVVICALVDRYRRNNL